MYESQDFSGIMTHYRCVSKFGLMLLKVKTTQLKNPPLPSSKALTQVNSFYKVKRLSGHLSPSLEGQN